MTAILEGAEHRAHVVLDADVRGQLDLDVAHEGVQGDLGDAGSEARVREIELDIAEGADIVMVKPALPYLDIISQARQRFDIPIAAYNVSGEYMMIIAAAKSGVFDLNSAMLESLTSIRRAGADIIITYFAKAAAALLNER
jgi:porphobilinogen synthase